jgi:hypothetical protein
MAIILDLPDVLVSTFISTPTQDCPLGVLQNVKD